MQAVTAEKCAGSARARSPRKRRNYPVAKAELWLRNLCGDVRDLPADDVGANLIDLRDFRLRDLRADLPDADTVLLQAEDDVSAALELSVDDAFDREVNRSVHSLHRAREDVRAEERLVGVNADAPNAVLLRRIECSQTTAARDLEDHAGALLDLVQRDLLALRLVGEVLG